MANLTEGLSPLTPGVPAEIPKAHRPLRAMVATVADVSGHSIVGFHNKEQYAVDKALKRACESSAAVVLVTRGKRFGTTPLDPCGRRHIVVDVEHLDDPERDRQMCIHDEAYRWERHGQDMLVWIPISESSTSKEIDCLLLKTHINASVAGQVIFDGVPGLEIDEDESYWEIEMDSSGQRCVCIHLRKDHEFQRWPPKLLK
eukprot:s3952_g2.t1